MRRQWQSFVKCGSSRGTWLGVHTGVSQGHVIIIIIISSSSSSSSSSSGPEETGRFGGVLMYYIHVTAAMFVVSREVCCLKPRHA